MLVIVNLNGGGTYVVALCIIHRYVCGLAKTWHSNKPQQLITFQNSGTYSYIDMRL